MANRSEGFAARSTPGCRSRLPLFLPTVGACLLAGCAAPGAPRPPRPPVPETVADLSAHQLGESVELTFTLPRRSVEGDPLNTAPQIEIYRAFVAANPAVPAGEMPNQLVYTIPSALADAYLAEGRFRFLDPLSPQEMAQRAGERALYLVRTRASKRKESAASNVAAVTLAPVPAPIAAFEITVTQDALELHWQVPELTASGRPAPPPLDYRIYRAEVQAGDAAEAQRNPSQAKLAAPAALLGITPAPEYRDTHFEFGRTYIYRVRSVVAYGAESVESADSAPAVITPRDTFPPAAPQGLVALPVAASPAAPTSLDLSWNISPEPDLAGYNLYRSEQEGLLGQRVNTELLLTPTFRDISILAGRKYYYAATAVDRSGNESLPSKAVSASVPSESEKTKP